MHPHVSSRKESEENHSEIMMEHFSSAGRGHVQRRFDGGDYSAFSLQRGCPRTNGTSFKLRIGRSRCIYLAIVLQSSLLVYD